VLSEIDDIVLRNTQEFQDEMTALFDQARLELTEELQEILRMAYERRRQLHLAALAAGRVQSSVVVPSLMGDEGDGGAGTPVASRGGPRRSSKDTGAATGVGNAALQDGGDLDRDNRRLVNADAPSGRASAGAGGGGAGGGVRAWDRYDWETELTAIGGSSKPQPPRA
jgi:hypothetical protein